MKGGERVDVGISDTGKTGQDRRGMASRGLLRRGEVW